MLVNGVAEREKSKLHEFEMLKSKWNTDDCNAKKQSPTKMGKGDYESSQEPPDYIHDTGKAAGWPTVIFNF